MQSDMFGKCRAYINEALTFAIIISIGLLPLIATQGLKTLLWLLILSSLFNKDFVTNIKSNSLILITCMQYPLVHLLIEFISTNGPNGTGYSASVFAPWLFGIIAIILCAGFFQYKTVDRIIKYAIPVGFIITFAYLSYQYVVTNGSKVEPTGVGGLFYFITSLLMTHFAFYYLFDLSKKWSKNFLLTFIMIAFILIVSLIFTQTRGILIAQVFTIVIMSFVFFRNLGLYSAYPLIASVFIVFISGLSYLVMFNSGATSRLYNIVQAVHVLKSYESASKNTQNTDTSFVGSILEKSADLMDYTAQKIEGSGGRRLEMWSVATKEIASNPMKVRGTSGETNLLSKDNKLQRHSHVHNMYLSWYLWGGPISLISGVLFMATPLLIYIFDKPIKVSNIYLPLSLTLFWGISMIFDSFLRHAGVFHIYIPLIFLTCWATQHQNNIAPKFERRN